MYKGMEVAVKPAGAVKKRRTLARWKATIIGIDPAKRKALIRLEDGRKGMVNYSRITGRWEDRPSPKAGGLTPGND
jgi:hypothetical protein